MANTPDRPVVLITGASRGIGLAAAQGFLKDGYTVVGISRGIAEELAAATAEGRVLQIRGDLACEASIEAAVDRAITQFGRIDALINNSGMQLIENFLDAPFERWKQVVDVNLTGLAYMTYRVLPHMVAAGRGRIVNIVSRAPESRKEKLTAYASTKAAVVSFTRTLAAEFEGDGRPDIRVNGLIPGVTRTAMFQELGWDGDAQSPAVVYPFNRQLVEADANGPNGEVFWEGKRYPLYRNFLDKDDPGLTFDNVEPSGAWEKEFDRQVVAVIFPSVSRIPNRYMRSSLIKFIIPKDRLRHKTKGSTGDARRPLAIAGHTIVLTIRSARGVQPGC